MKGLFIVFVTFALVNANVSRDWDNIKHDQILVGSTRYTANTFGNRIVGGNEATANSFPYQVAIFITTSQGISFCGGSLISTKFVLTAAHCIDTAIDVEIILGAHNIRQEEVTQQRFRSSTFRIHSQWSSTFIRNDIATIELPEAADLNAYVQLVTLPRHSDVSNSYAGSVAVASGWGKDSDASQSVSDVLRTVQLPVITNLICRLSYPFIIQDTNVCTSTTGGMGTCQGDSGGPLTVNGVQIGIVSFGSARGCEAGTPAAFCRVTSYLDWIEANSDVTIAA